MTPRKMFVYGILKGYKSDATKGYILNYEKFLANGYYTIKRKKGSIVFGEIIEVDDSDLKVFDTIEGVHINFYKRYISTAYNEDAVKELVWIYRQVKEE